MNLLAFDTTFGACSVALATTVNDEEIYFNEFEERTRGHAERLVPMMESVLARAGVSYPDLNRIIVTNGPGTFTGMRVGIAAAKALKLGQSVPVTICSSLQLLAFGAMTAPGPNSEAHIGVAVDARRDQIYFALYDRDGQEILPPDIGSKEDIRNCFPNESILLVGSAAATIAGETEPASMTDNLKQQQPDALNLVKMAHRLPHRDQPIAPLYLRPADAKPQTGKSLKRL
ncbi:MAG: tRNA (adenosine(37)-N6)-threonylcarbamoyltransferase complex dimerization subunit type 1 TsaB [Methyloligellaceae bacterium]